VTVAQQPAVGHVAAGHAARQHLEELAHRGDQQLRSYAHREEPDPGSPARSAALSVAVLVDGAYSVNSDGVRVYTPRVQKELEQMESLVKSAVGWDGQRGDQVDVVNMQFRQPRGRRQAAPAPSWAWSARS